MIFHRLPETLFTGPARFAVLRELVRHPHREWTGHDVARSAAVSVPWTIQSLKAFEALGLVSSRRVRPADLWSLNGDHVLLPEILRVVDLDATMTRELHRILKRACSGPGVVSAVVFGSAARRQETPFSDIDLLIVVADRKAKARLEAGLSRARQAILHRFGNRLETTVYTKTQLHKRKGLALIESIRRDGIVLKGALP